MQHQHRFLQNYLGHILNKKDINAPNSRATDHYFHYYLVDEHRTPITTKGVKLKDIPQLPESPQDITTQSPETPAPQTLTTNQPKPNENQYLKINPEQYSRWVNVLENISSANTQSDACGYASLIAIFEAIKQWNQLYNDKPKGHSRRHRNFALTKSLLEREFNIHREAAEFLEANQIQIDQYHKSIGITKTRGHNRQVGRNIEELKNFVNYTINTSI